MVVDVFVATCMFSLHRFLAIIDVVGLVGNTMRLLLFTLLLFTLLLLLLVVVVVVVVLCMLLWILYAFFLAFRMKYVGYLREEKDCSMYLSSSLRYSGLHILRALR